MVDFRDRLNTSELPISNFYVDQPPNFFEIRSIPFLSQSHFMPLISISKILNFTEEPGGKYWVPDNKYLNLDTALPSIR